MRILEAFLEPAHPMAGTDWQGGSQHFCSTEKDMLPSRASRCTSRGTGQASPLLPSARDGCSGMKVGAHPGLPRAVLQGRVPAPQGTLCWGRDSAPCQGQHSACPGSSPWGRGDRLWVEGAVLGGAGQGCAAAERVLCGSGLLTAPHHHEDISGGLFSRGRSRQGLM